MTRAAVFLVVVLASSTTDPIHAQGKPFDTGQPAQGNPSDTGQRAQGKPNMVETASVKVLTGLTVPEFEQEMQHFVQAIGVPCGGCHVPRGNFASDENPRKLKARQMIEMTKALNKQFFPNHKPAEGESVLGRVTCYTCHQGEAQPKTR